MNRGRASQLLSLTNIQNVLYWYCKQLTTLSTVQQKPAYVKTNFPNVYVSDDIVKALSNASNDGILIISENHKVSHVNNNLKLWLRLNQLDTTPWIQSPDILAYDDITDVTSDPYPIQELFNTVAGKETLISETVDIEFQNNMYRYMNVYTSPMFHQQEGYLGRLWVFDDRTKERQVDEMKTEFISIASHELKTPVSIVKNYLEMLLDGDVGSLDEEIQEFIQTAMEGTNRLSEIINDLLEISRFDSGKKNISKSQQNVRKIIEDIIHPYNELIQEKRQNFNIEYNLEKPTLNLDLNMMQHIVGNVLDNAIKYTPEKGDVEMRIKSYSKFHQGILRLEIKDSGMGIPEKEQNNIFQKFYRASNAKKSTSKGTGIGLYFVKTLVETLGVKIWFNSIPNNGTTFFIEIPE